MRTVSLDFGFGRKDRIGGRRWKGALWTFVLLGAFVWGPGSAAADAGEEDLRELVLALQAEVRLLRSEVDRLKGEEARTTPAQTDSLPVVASAPVRVDAAAVPEPPMQSRAGFSWELYGYLKADVFHDSATTSHQEVPYWVLPEDRNCGGELDFTARQTRLGIDLQGPVSILDGGLSGKLEMDFFGHVPSPGDVGGNHAYALRSRHLYLQWASDQWSVLAGKTWEAYQVEIPDTLNFGTYFFQGELGHRRMQLRTSYKTPQADRSWEWTVALDEPVAGVHGADLDGDGADDAARSEWPGLVGRVRYAFPVGGEQARLSLAGFYAREEVDCEEFPAHAVILGGSLPLGSQFRLKGTLWSGRNVDGARGGIGQGINRTLERGIEAWGGWVQLRYQPAEDWWFNLGCSVDNPKDTDLSPGQRARNATFLLNGYHQIAEPLLVGLEYFQVTTDYLAGPAVTNHRVQSSVILKY